MPQPTAPIYAPPEVPNAAQNMRGIVLMALAFFIFAAADTMAKLLTQSLHPFQIVWFRQSGLFAGVCLVVLMRGFHHLQSVRPGLQIARGLTATASATLFIIAITHVPLADAVAVSFIAPFLVTVLGALILKEAVGWRRWTAVAVGFCGMLLVIRPGLGVFHPAIFLVVLAATMFALRQILSRFLSGADSVLTTVAYTAGVSFGLASLTLPFVWVTPPTPQVWILAIGVAVLAAVGELLIILALSMAQAVVVAPLHYTLILWGTFYGYVVFAQLPDQWTLIGCAVIVASGLYTINRERQAARRIRAQAPD